MYYKNRREDKKKIIQSKMYGGDKEMYKWVITGMV